MCIYVTAGQMELRLRTQTGSLVNLTTNMVKRHVQKLTNMSMMVRIMTNSHSCLNTS